MVSLNATAANASVLASLRKINSDIAVNQTRIGTGLKINKYSDNAALYTAAQGIRSNIKAFDQLSADIGIAKGQTDAAAAGLEKISEIVTSIQELALSTSSTATAAEAAVTAGKIKNYVSQIGSVISASGFQGKNLIKATPDSLSVKLSNETSATAAFAGIDVAAGSAMATLLTDGAAVTTGASIAALVTGTVLTEVTTALGKTQAFSELLGSQLDFQTTLKGINETALGSIVDANMEEEAAKSSALQVKQQLAYQALAIGNNSAQNLLLLFR